MEQYSLNLVYLRTSCGEDVATTARKAALSVERLHAFETGNLFPSPDELIRLSDHFQVSIDTLLRHPVHAKRLPDPAKIKLVVLDVDGVITDGGIIVTESGEDVKRFDVKDGRAIVEMGKAGMEVAFLSGGSREGSLRARAERLHVSRFYVGKAPKIDIMRQWSEEMNMPFSNMAVVGDDVNDLEIMKACAFSACPSDAVDRVKSEVDVVLTKRGGHGAVREFAERWMKIKI